MVIEKKDSSLSENYGNQDDFQKAKKIKKWIIACSIFFGILFYPAVIANIFSVMLFDAPGSENSTYTIILFRSINLVPLLIMLSIPASWIAYKLKKYSLALAIALLPLMGIAFFAISLYLMYAVCNGELVC